MIGSGTVSLRDTRSAEIYARAQARLPGGVNSPVRAMRAIGRDPLFVDRGSGAELTDVDGNRYVDWVCSWGPLIHGHAHPEIVAAVTAAAARGTSFGAPTAAEVELADELVVERVPCAEQVRFTSSGTEASDERAAPRARRHRAATRSSRSPATTTGTPTRSWQRAGRGSRRSDPGEPGGAGRHGRADAAGALRRPGVASSSWPRRARRPGGRSRRSCSSRSRRTWASSSRAEGFLRGLRALCDRAGALLVFDEVITGFRVALRRRAGRSGVTPDLATFGKVIGGGLPVGASAGRRELMEQFAPVGHVYQAGTLAATRSRWPPASTALRLLDDGAYRRRPRRPKALAAGLREAAAAAVRGRCRSPPRPGCSPVFFSERARARSLRVAQACDLEAPRGLCRALLARGVYPPPSQFEAWFPSLAHGRDGARVVGQATLGIRCEHVHADASGPMGVGW